MARRRIFQMDAEVCAAPLPAPQLTRWRGTLALKIFATLPACLLKQTE
jgi:hypothetical protein